MILRDKIFGEPAVLRQIYGDRKWSKDSDGCHVYEFDEEQLKKIKKVKLPKTGKSIFNPGFLSFTKQGAMVKIRPCAEKYNNKTYVGFYLGDLPLSVSVGVHGDTLVTSLGSENPAIFVPELGEIIFGAESWWREINSEKELSDITDDDIQNVWYVKMLKAIQERKKDEQSGD